MRNLSFAYPGFFYLLLVLIPFIIWYFYKFNKANATIQISSLNGFKNTRKSIRLYFQHLLFILRIAILTLLIIVLARPQSSNSWQDVTTEGIDIVMALDISASMQSLDFKPNRLEAAKEYATEFILNRPNDRIGLVVFSGESFTQCPLTVDHAVVINLLKDIKITLVDDGTGIGMGLSTAINRLKNSHSKSKVIILLTDGVNNTGSIPPLTAADISKTFGFRIYTIGVGTLGVAPYPVQTPFGIQYQNVPVEIDEVVLKEIADMTGGKYFRATGNLKLQQIYKEIDKLEKSKIDVKEYSKKKEEYLIYALIACGLFLIEILLRNTWLKSIP